MKRSSEWSATRPTAVEGVECFSARFVSHVFDRHSHETFAIGTTFGGVQSFRCRGERRNSMEGHLMLINPGDPHDGWAGTRVGFAYRMLYISAEEMSQLVDGDEIRTSGHEPRISHGMFREPVVQDPGLAAEFAAATDDLLLPSNSLRAAERLSAVLRPLFERYGGVREPASDTGVSSRIGKVRDLLESRYSEDITVGLVAEVAGMSRVHATRQFTVAYGMPPHAYLNQVRIRHAKQLLLAGVSAVDVATDVGFADQSHFTRRFKRSVGVSPLAWARSMGQPA